MTSHVVNPPEGTAHNSHHILSAEGHLISDPRIEFRATWSGTLWTWKGCMGISPEKAAHCGFEYVRAVAADPVS